MESSYKKQLETQHAITNCDFHHVGCSVKLPCKDMPEHLKENAINHLSLLAKKHVEIEAENQLLKNKFDLLVEENSQIEAYLKSQTFLCDTQAAVEDKAQQLKLKLEKLYSKKHALANKLVELRRIKHQIHPERTVESSPYVIPCAPPIITMTNFQKLKSKDTWFSPPMYTDHHGYKICLGVIANDIDFFGVAKDSRASLFVYFMRGEFDDYLDWPFRGSILFLLHNYVNGEYVTFTFIYDSKVPDTFCSRVTEGERAVNGLRCQDSIAHSYLVPFLQNDSLTFELHSMRPHSTKHNCIDTQ